MNYRKTMLFNTLELPAYWAACRKQRDAMDVREERISYGPHRRQYAIVLRGAISQPTKIAYYFHGGAWTFGRPENFTAAAIPWLAQGFTVVFPSYRRPPQVGLNRIVADCRSCMTALAPTANVTHLHVGGISAGAHLAALLALHPTWWTAAGWPTTPQKALLCAGPLCLQRLWPAAIFNRYAHLDPYALIRERTASDVAWQLLHGTADATVAYQHAPPFLDRLREFGHTANLLTLPGGTHLDSGRWMFGGKGAEVVADFLRTGG